MRTKEINDLESEAGSHETRARELRVRAKNLRYLDLLEKLGLVDNEVIEYEGVRVAVDSLEGYTGSWLSGYRVKKDGELSSQRKTIYYAEKIKKLSGGAP